MAPDENPGDTRRLKNAVTIWNDSGGVGKTTTTINTAEALAQNGDDVLVIDLDPQHGGLTDHAGYEAALSHPKYNIVEVLMMPNRSLEDIIIPADESNGLSWDLLPAHEDLEEFSKKLGNNLPPDENVLVQLRKNIQSAGLHNQYEYILIDCRASRGELVGNAVAATRNVMIPTEFSRKGSRSVDGMVTFVEQKQRELRHVNGLSDDISTGVIAIVPNNAAKTGQLTNNEKASLEYMLRDHTENMPSFYIPSRTALSDAWTAQKSLLEYIETTEDRDFRPNEKILPKMYDVLAEMVRKGSAKAVDDSHVANIPEECYPDDATSATTEQAVKGGAQ